LSLFTGCGWVWGPQPHADTSVLMGGGLGLVVDAITELHAGISQLRCSHVGRLLHVRGIVIRAGPPKVMEAAKEHVCTKCKHRFTVRASLAHGGKLKLPRVCPAGREDGGEGDLCPGGNFRPLPETTLLRDYQEVKLQESVHDASGIPRCDSALHELRLSRVLRGVYASGINRAVNPCMQCVQHACTHFAEMIWLTIGWRSPPQVSDGGAGGRSGGHVPAG
jgi:hypothetical protein